ncbi:MAG: Rieske (2Fe-2S) protein [Rhodospirillales bacterium]|nr:Rieske (2Fe-2S) protein [Rhodospirillales bacterium]
MDINDLMTPGEEAPKAKDEPLLPPQEQRLCALSDIEEGESAGFEAQQNGKDIRVLLVRQEDSVNVYINKCPHVGVPLDLLEGQFLTSDKSRIICATHGALFQIENGDCVSGPCIGKALTPIKSMVKDGEVFITA